MIEDFLKQEKRDMTPQSNLRRGDDVEQSLDDVPQDGVVFWRGQDVGTVGHRPLSNQVL